MTRRVITYIRRHHIGLLALFVALTGTAYAAGLPKNSVKSKQIKDGQVKTKDLGNGAVTPAKAGNVKRLNFAPTGCGENGTTPACQANVVSLGGFIIKASCERPPAGYMYPDERLYINVSTGLTGTTTNFAMSDNDNGGDIVPDGHSQGGYPGANGGITIVSVNHSQVGTIVLHSNSSTVTVNFSAYAGDDSGTTSRCEVFGNAVVS